MNNPYQPPASDLSMPEVAVPDELAKDIRNGWIAACISGAITLVVVLITIAGTPVLGFDASALIDVVFIFALAFGVYRKSRTASTILLLYFIASKIYMMSLAGAPNGIVLAVVFGYYYTKAMVATYKYQSLVKAARAGSA